MDTNRIRTLTSNLFSKKVRILGRSIPIATVALAVTFVGALAWVSIFLFASRFAVTTTDALLAPTASGSWTCALKAGTGASIDLCDTLAGSTGPEIVVSGLSESDLYVQAMRKYVNPNGVPITLTLVGAQNSYLPVTLETIGGLPLASVTIAAGDNQDIFMGMRSVGMTGGMSLDVTALELRFAP